MEILIQKFFTSFTIITMISISVDLDPFFATLIVKFFTEYIKISCQRNWFAKDKRNSFNRLSH